jgi:hypothetical protein
MKKAFRRVDPLLWILLLVSALLLPAPMYAENDVMGEIQFEGKSHVEKTSGVWVDGQYVGYLKELKGSKKVLLLPGEHVITSGRLPRLHRTNSCPAWPEGSRSRGHGESPYRTAS